MVVLIRVPTGLLIVIPGACTYCPLVPKRDTLYVTDGLPMSPDLAISHTDPVHFSDMRIISILELPSTYNLTWSHLAPIVPEIGGFIPDSTTDKFQKLMGTKWDLDGNFNT